ncbi:MAG: hypothetical protein SP4CHLAM5_02660 [Chlamydiia bacterium]|nr:hypothetical protein [Chlamydiia bacterium]MCH9618140.1 hypothetical protein [Chlamydiia bacterium]MCH9624020.1 hypothetical protein [Chlamydiia bacterium]
MIPQGYFTDRKYAIDPTSHLDVVCMPWKWIKGSSAPHLVVKITITAIVYIASSKVYFIPVLFSGAVFVINNFRARAQLEDWQKKVSDYLPQIISQAGILKESAEELEDQADLLANINDCEKNISGLQADLESSARRAGAALKYFDGYTFVERFQVLRNACASLMQSYEGLDQRVLSIQQDILDGNVQMKSEMVTSLENLKKKLSFLNSRDRGFFDVSIQRNQIHYELDLVKASARKFAEKDRKTLFRLASKVEKFKVVVFCFKNVQIKKWQAQLHKNLDECAALKILASQFRVNHKFYKLLEEKTKILGDLLRDINSLAADQPAADCSLGVCKGSFAKRYFDQDTIFKDKQERVIAYCYSKLLQEITRTQEVLVGCGNVRGLQRELTSLQKLAASYAANIKVATLVDLKKELNRILSILGKVQTYRSAPNPKETRIVVSIEVPRKLVEEYALKVFLQYSDALRKNVKLAFEHGLTYCSVGTKIKFDNELGQDAGGITREFLTLVWMGIFKKKAGLFVKHDNTRKPFLSYSSRPILSADTLYTNLGMFMRHAYLRAEQFLGKNIAHEEMDAIFSLSSDELQAIKKEWLSPFSISRKRADIQKLFSSDIDPLWKIVSKLAETRPVQERRAIKFQMNFLRNLNSNESYTEEIKEYASASDHYEDSMLRDIEPLHSEQEYQCIANLIYFNVKSLLFTDLRNLFTFHQAFNWGKIKNLWDVCYSQGARVVSATIQGELDRNKIVDESCLVIKGEPTTCFKQKVEWTKEWILRVATEQQLEDFLFVATGARCNYHNGLRFKQVSGKFPLFTFHSCFGLIEVSDTFIVGFDDTKEKHFEMLADVCGIKSYDMA